MQKKNEKLKTETHMSSSKGITLVALVTTIIIMIVLAGITIRIVFNDKIVEKAENYVEKMEKQTEEPKSISNMVRNLYENDS